MRILQFLPYLPYPPSSGGRMRSLSLIEHLSRDHEVRLVCFIKPGEERFLSNSTSVCDGIRTIPRSGSPTSKRILALSFSVDPILVRFYSSLYARDLLIQILSSSYFDVVHVETYYIIQNLPSNLKTPVVLAESNIEYLLAEQMARRVKSPLWKLILYLDALKQRIWERRAWHYADRCAAVTADDASTIAEHIKRPVCVVENGVDPTVRQVTYHHATEAHKILFVGNFHYRPNVDGILFFLQEVFPLILGRLPTAQLMIVGERPTQEILAFEDSPRINVRGFIDDLQPLFEETLVSICPIRIGSGSRLKILEALSRGHPVVTTTIGCSGLRVEQGNQLLIADTPRDFCRAVCSLLESRELREVVGTRGRKLVIRDYTWESSASALLKCYESAGK